MTKDGKTFEVSDTIMEEWQEIVDILAKVAGIPVALIMKYAEPYIEVFVRSDTEGNPYHVGDREVFENSGLYCETVIKSQEKLLVPNALKSEQWRKNPDVKLNMISYLGFPIARPDKTPFGTLCILDNKENSYREVVEKLMIKFCSILEHDLELQYISQTLGDDNRRLTDYLDELQKLRGMVQICASCKSIKDVEGNWKPIEQYLIAHPKAHFSHGICPECIKKLYPGFNNE